MEAQAAFLDIHIAPDPFKKRATRNDFAGALDEENEKIERAAAEANTLPPFFKPAFRGEEAEGAEYESRIPSFGHRQPFNEMPCA